MPEPNPAAIRPGIIDDSNIDCHKLVNSVERHTRCTPACRLRQKHVDTPAECRFGFPKDLQEETKMFYKLLYHHKAGTELHHWLNGSEAPG